MSNNKQNSVKILVEVEFEIDDIWSANSVDQEERAWFWNKVIPSCNILLHSNEVGDTVGETNTFTIKKISRKAREYTSPIIEELLNEKTMEMSNNKQTAVEWFFSELERMQYFIGNDMLEAYKEAKAMEKEQIIESYRLGHIFHDSNDSDSAQEYYDTEYGK